MSLAILTYHQIAGSIPSLAVAFQMLATNAVIICADIVGTSVLSTLTEQYQYTYVSNTL